MLPLSRRPPLPPPLPVCPNLIMFRFCVHLCIHYFIQIQRPSRVRARPTIISQHRLTKPARVVDLVCLVVHSLAKKRVDSTTDWPQYNRCRQGRQGEGGVRSWSVKAREFTQKELGLKAVELCESVDFYHNHFLSGI